MNVWKDFFHEKAEGNDVGEMAERADKEQPAARYFRTRLEAAEIDAVFDYGRAGSLQEFTIFVRHDDDLLVAPNRPQLEPPPAPPVPPRGEGFAPGSNLRVEIERDVVLHQNVSPVGRQIGIFHLRDIGLPGTPEFAHSPRVVLTCLGRREGGPTRLPIARLGDEMNLRYQRQHRREVRFGDASFGKRVKHDIEFVGGFAKEIEDADGAPMG